MANLTIKDAFKALENIDIEIIETPKKKIVKLSEAVKTKKLKEAKSDVLSVYEAGDMFEVYDEFEKLDKSKAEKVANSAIKSSKTAKEIGIKKLADLWVAFEEGGNEDTDEVLLEVISALDDAFETHIYDESCKSKKVKKSLKEAEESEQSKVVDFIKDAVEGLKKEEATNYKYDLDGLLGLFVGWSAGYGEEKRDDCIQSEENPDYAINVGIKVKNPADWAEFDYLNFPYHENGEVEDLSISIEPDEDYNKLAQYVLEMYDNVKDLDIDDDGLIHEEDKLSLKGRMAKEAQPDSLDDEIEESCKFKELKEEYISDFSWILNRDIDITTKEDLDNDYRYWKLLTSVNDAERFNYRSDYWGSAEEYQEQAIEVMERIENSIGEKIKVVYDDCVVICKLIGLLVDKQYNSHLQLLVEDVEEIEESCKSKKHKKGLKETKEEPTDMKSRLDKFVNKDMEVEESCKLKEEPQLEPIHDGRKSFYGKADWHEEQDGTKVLYSYDTKVCEITPDGKVKLLSGSTPLSRGYKVALWRYSPTTLRHVKEFLKQNGFKADSVKQMEKDYLGESLTEGTLVNINDTEEVKKGIEELEKPVEVETTEKIVDVDADTVEKIKDSYIGNVILQCPVCRTLVYKEPDKLVKDEETELYNLEDECPHCGSVDGYELVGQVAKADVEISSEEEEEEKPEELPVEEPVEEVEDEEEFTFESLDTDKFDNLINRYMHEVYSNVGSYETTLANVDDENNQIIVEGKIKFNSGKEKTTKFVFEAHLKTVKGKYKFKGLNETFSKTKGFTLTTTLNENMLVPESFWYNYNVNQLNESKQIKGSVRL